MSWGAEPERTKEDFISMDQETKSKMTWDECEKFVAFDTMDIASFQGAKEWAEKSGKSPAEALSRFFGISDRE